VRDNHLAVGALTDMLWQHVGDELVGRSVKTVAAHALGGEFARQGEQLRDGWLAAVEGGVEAGGLRHLGQGSAHGVDASEVVRLVQRRERDELAQRLNGGVVEADRRGKALAAMHDAMADADDLPAGLVRLQPVDEEAHRRLVLLVGRALQAEVGIVEHGTVGVLGLEVRLGANAVDLAGHHRLGRDFLVVGEQGKLDRGRACVEDE